MSKRFRVAFSFAGEMRPFVKEAAHRLAARFSQNQILYDEFHEAEFARPNLAFHLPKLYRDETTLIVVVLCEEYQSKEWPGLEWRAIYSLIKKRRESDVMLARFCKAEAEGLHDLAGFAELDEKTPQQFANLILERLAIEEGVERSTYLASPNGHAHPDWPETAPAFDWPLANHDEAQKAFAQLITRSSRFRMLPIAGARETGKTLLTKLFLVHASSVAGFRCAIFDFADPANMQEKMRTFAENLDVPAPAPNGGISPQLSEIFERVKAVPEPTLLIFDNFDKAGDAAGRWIRKTLLHALIKVAHSWLRVVIVGKESVEVRNEVWEGHSAKPIPLAPPTPEEWHKFSLKHRPERTLDEVRNYHRVCSGRCSMLAQILGPEDCP